MSDTKDTWRRRVASWRASGQTADSYAAENGLTASTLRWWSSQLKRDTTAPVVRMAQVIRPPVSPASPARRGSVVVDILDLGARVTIEDGVQRETLAAVFGALGIGGAQ